MIGFGTGGWRAVIGEEFTKANVQPPVPNPIMCFPSPSLPVCVRGYSVTSTCTMAPAGCTGTGPRISLPSTVRRRTPFCRPSGLCTAMR